jgi:hypothetical protein
MNPQTAPIRKYPGLLARFGLAALFFFSLPSTALAQGYLGGNLIPYAVLAGTTVTCAGAGLITGDIGVSPGAAIVGFPAPCTDIGVLLIPPAANPGQADLLIAFGTLAAQVCDATVGPDLAGLTLVPGTYCVNAAATNLSGLLQLNAQGNPNAVWVFKMTSTLITSVGSTVSIINGGPANSCGAQWLVNSSATIAGGTTFRGNILALTDITMDGNLTGRALARNGQVTMVAPNASFAACGAGAGAGGAPPPFPVFGAGFGGALGPTPTVSEWGMLILAVLLAIVGFAAMRRRAR